MVVMPLLQNIALLLALIVGYDMLSDTISSILPRGRSTQTYRCAGGSQRAPRS
jgi:hypothetical protein